LAFDDPIDFIVLGCILLVLYFGFVRKSKEKSQFPNGVRSFGYLFFALGLFSFVFLSLFTIMFIIVGLLLILLSHGAKQRQFLGNPDHSLDS
jgi:hypothetical protein